MSGKITKHWIQIYDIFNLLWQVCIKRLTIVGLCYGMDLPKIVGENVRGFRTLQGLSREQLCERANINLNHLGAIERGEENVTLDTLGKLGIALGMEPYAFLTKDCYKWGVKKD
jgi:DNA-binding XRE family transcriptional regulator